MILLCIGRAQRVIEFACGMRLDSWMWECGESDYSWLCTKIETLSIWHWIQYFPIQLSNEHRLYTMRRISHSCFSLNCNVWQLCLVWLDRVREYKRLFPVLYGIRQHSSNKKVVRIKSHTLFIGRVLYCPLSHSNKDHLHIACWVAFIIETVLLLYCSVIT